jgi:hypothetical protein
MTTSTLIGQSQRNKETGEPDDATSIKSGSEGGWEKRPKGPRSQPTRLQCSKAAGLRRPLQAHSPSKKACASQRLRYFGFANSIRPFCVHDTRGLCCRHHVYRNSVHQSTSSWWVARKFLDGPRKLRQDMGFFVQRLSCPNRVRTLFTLVRN